MGKAGITTLLLFLGTTSMASAVTFQPSDADIGDLDHRYYYTWGINWTIPAGEYITTATLTIKNINNWQIEPNILYIHLLDNPPLGLTSAWDNEGGGDNFAGQGILLTTYTDNWGIPGPAENFVYSFTAPQIATLTTYLANSRFGFGFDPDCHYFNDGVSLVIKTAPVPEPSSTLIGAMACGLGFVVPRRRQAAA